MTNQTTIRDLEALGAADQGGGTYLMISRLPLAVRRKACAIAEAAGWEVVALETPSGSAYLLTDVAK